MKYSKIFLLINLLLFPVYTSTAQSHDFVSIEGKQFIRNGKDFYPTSLNYKVAIVHKVENNNDIYYVAPFKGNFAENSDPETIVSWGCDDQVSCYGIILDNFHTIKDMGFNSLRVVGIEFGTAEIPEESTPENPVFYQYPVQNYWHNGNQWDGYFPIDADYSNLFIHYENILEAARIADLKVQFLVGGNKVTTPQWRYQYRDFLEELSQHFSEDTTLYSYDFINEPKGREKHNPDEIYSKGEICEIVQLWNDAVHDNSPFHLTTIGLGNPLDIATWDQRFLQLDFLSFHLYPGTKDIYNPNFELDLGSVINDIKWISNNTALPWIIGEISFSASDLPNIPYPLHGTEYQQQIFAKETLEAVRDCGGSGYTWWIYRDYRKHKLEKDQYRNYMGLWDFINEPKEAAYEFENFDPKETASECPEPPNYYDYYNVNTNPLSHTINDQFDQPIKDAIIRVNTGGNYEHSVFTYSNENGNFTLNSPSLPYHLITISAPGSNTVSIHANALPPEPIILNQFQPEEDIILNNFSVLSGETNVQEANNSINCSNTVIYSGGSSFMKAAKDIILKPGFQAKLGSDYKGLIGVIFPNCNSVESNYSKNNSENIDSTTTVNSTNSSEHFKVFPNPNSGLVNIHLSDYKIESVTIKNLFGQLIAVKNNLNSKKVKINFEDELTGMYFLIIKDEKNNLYQSKIILK